jgi:hypothetical protein
MDTNISLLHDVYNKYPSVLSAFRFVMDNNTGNGHRYHNIHHLFYVFKYSVLFTHECSFYHSCKRKEELYIAAIFHDYEHVGKMGDDSVNIALAKNGVDKFAKANPNTGIDYEYVKYLIGCTEFPYKNEASELTIEGMALRDADMSYFFEDVSLVALYSGLRDEFGTTPKDFLTNQEKFIRSVQFNSPTYQYMWTDVYRQLRLAELNLLKKAYEIS